MNGKSRLQWAEEEVSEVKGIMMENLKKADERADKLEDLEDRAEDMLAKVRGQGSHNMPTPRGQGSHSSV